MTLRPPSAFRPVVQSSSFEHWRACLQQVMGDCRVSCLDHERDVFQASIQVVAAGPLSLVELRGEGGGLELLRRQNSEMAVLWIPELGCMLERQADCPDELITSPGQALWIAPGAELHGLSSANTSGVSILVPVTVLEALGDQGGRTAVLDPFRINRQPTVVALLRQARELIDAARLHPHWLDHSAGAFWQALINHRLAAGSASLIPPDDDLTNRFLELVQSRLTAEAEPRFALGKLALDLHCSARTLQNRLRSDLDASPGEVWTALQNQQRPAQQITSAALGLRHS